MKHGQKQINNTEREGVIIEKYLLEQGLKEQDGNNQERKYEKYSIHISIRIRIEIRKHPFRKIANSSRETSIRTRIGTNLE